MKKLIICVSMIAAIISSSFMCTVYIINVAIENIKIPSVSYAPINTDYVKQEDYTQNHLEEESFDDVAQDMEEKYKESMWDVFSKDDIKLLLQCVETECYDQDYESKVNVANVIFNRLDHGGFGDTIGEIICSDKQFSFYRESISSTTISACMYAYDAGDMINGCIGFHSNKKTDTFCNWEYVFTDEAGHHFYKEKESE